MRARGKPPVGPIRRLPENYFQGLDAAHQGKIAKTKEILIEGIGQVREMIEKLEGFFASGEVEKLHYWAGRYVDRRKQLINKMDARFKADNLLPIDVEEVPELVEFNALDDFLRDACRVVANSDREHTREWMRRIQNLP